MSALAKVFVVLNLLLSLLFFGTSATLFLTRRNLKVESISYKNQLTEARTAFENRAEKLTAVISAQDKALLNLQNSEKNATVALLKEKEAVKTQTARADKAETERARQVQLAESHLNLANTREQRIQELTGQLQAAVDKRDEAMAASAQAIAERNRMARDLEQANTELHLTKVALVDIETKNKTYQLELAAYKGHFGDIPPSTTRESIDALIEAVDESLQAVVLSVGEDQGVKEGDDFYVYRDDQYVGRVRVSKTYRDLSGAKIVLEADGAKIRSGDRATTKLN
ncbi:MAG: hypothetical protein JXA90_12125 [Planctomycetes bacterium]|nr:hypothetical protein [Planctomycetota bacterium]